MQERKEKGDFSAEKAFIQEMSGLDSMITIGKLWNDSPVREDYPEVGKYIDEKKEYERLHGRGYMRKDDLKNKIAGMLMDQE